jgi:hypothetical protein
MAECLPGHLFVGLLIASTAFYNLTFLHATLGWYRYFIGIFY